MILLPQDGKDAPITDVHKLSLKNIDYIICFLRQLMGIYRVRSLVKKADGTMDGQCLQRSGSPPERREAIDETYRRILDASSPQGDRVVCGDVLVLLRLDPSISRRGYMRMRATVPVAMKSESLLLRAAGHRTQQDRSDHSDLLDLVTDRVSSGENRTVPWRA